VLKRYNQGRRHPVKWVACFALLLAFVLPAAAQAVWSAPLDLSDPGQRAEFPALEVDQTGNAVFSWDRKDGTAGCGGSGCYRVQARVRSAAGALGAVQTLSAAGTDAGNAGFGLDQNGNAVFAWVQSDGSTDCDGSATSCYRVKTRARSAAGALSTTQTISGPGRSAHYTGVAVDPNGNAVFVWSRYDGTTDCGDLNPGCLRVVTRARSAAGALSAVQTLSAPGQDAYQPLVAVDQDGNAVFVWARSDGTKRRIQARARSAAGSLSATQTLSDPGQNAFSPRVVVDQSGNAIFAWSREDGSSACGQFGCERIQARVRSAAGALSAVQTLTDGGRTAIRPAVAVDQNGNAIFAWMRKDDTADCSGSGGCPFRVQTRVRSGAGSLNTVQTLSDPGQAALYPSVAVDQSGNAVFVWQRRDGTTTTGCPASGCLRIQARTRSAAGTLGTVQDLSAAGRNAQVPLVAVSPAGNAVAAWQRFDGAYDRIQAATGP
jgi:hypothetical protein